MELRLLNDKGYVIPLKVAANPTQIRRSVVGSALKDDAGIEVLDVWIDEVHVRIR